MKVIYYFLIGSFSIIMGINLYKAAYIFYESMWRIRSLFVSGYPISAFRNPVVLIGIVVLILAVVGGFGIVIGKKVAGLWKDKSNKIAYFALLFFVISLNCVLHAIHYVCVEGYNFYVDYRMVAAISFSETQISQTHDVIIYLATRMCIIGILYFLVGAFSWGAALIVSRKDVETLVPSEENE
ncbi:MAG: hypothetical protein HXS44_01010 [Theionarchaea archaeon]|nr:hypothetical protein [Theionarchaea archaeon]